MSKDKRPKLTKEQRAAWNNGSRFIRVIPADYYSAFLASPEAKPKYNAKGYRIP